MEDRAIIELFWQRDEAAIRESERKYGSYCRSIAGNILSVPEDREECLSDTWLKAWNSIPPQRPNVLRIYLGRITRSLALDRVRAKMSKKRGSGVQPLPLEELRELSSGNDDPLDVLECKRMAECLTAFLRQLPPEKRRLFLLRYWYLEPLSAISEETGLTEHKIRNDLYRTRKKLKDYLIKEDFSL